ncbi:YkvA family protein [Cryptosporangium sp. NPDC048952]|uniref:YkvA family protein n=1 Tax=Cryptosporangium sp. NPDC048952 TaxID=3363961 RepID=UPI00371DCA6E
MARNASGSLRRKTRLAAAAKVAREASRPGSPSVGARIGAIPRMIRASASGRYPGLSRLKLAMLGVGAAYIVSPIDAMPEAFMFVLGLADDAAVAVYLVGALFAETDNFLEWERMTAPSTINGHAY